MDFAKLMQSYAAVVKFGSFTQAAIELGVTRALLSKRIKKLESALGVKLLNRNTHGLSVTAAGADYYEGCSSLLTQMRALTEKIQDRRAELTGEIKLFASKTFSETVLAPIIAEFCAKHPEVTIRIMLINRDAESYGMHLVSGGYDLAVLSVPISDSSLVARPIGRVNQVLVAAPQYLERGGAPNKPTDLIEHNCLDPSGALFSTWELIGEGERIPVRVTGRLQTNGTLLVRHMALQGLGIAILREYLVAGYLANGSLVRVLPKYSIDQRTINIVFQKDAYQPRRIKVFADFLAQRVATATSSSAASMSNSATDADQRKTGADQTATDRKRTKRTKKRHLQGRAGAA